MRNYKHSLFDPRHRTEMNKRLKLREKLKLTKISYCAHEGHNCLNTYMQIFKSQKNCQYCEMELGIISEVREHFNSRNTKGQWYKGKSGNPIGKTKGKKCSILTRITWRLNKYDKNIRK